jgi:uncharacterized membrane protein required for colicin V production
MGKFPFNWFDIMVVAILAIGALRGRKRGMSQELLPLLKWITLVLVCGFFHYPVAVFISGFSNLFSEWLSVVVAYLGLAFLVFILFSLVSRSLGGKIIGSDVFGGAEYYLGIGSGILRWTCMLIFSLALLNSRFYSQQEIAERTAFVKQNYDSDFFPAIYQIQDYCFRNSMSGPYVTKGLSSLLIAPANGQGKAIKRKEFDLPM